MAQGSRQIQSQAQQQVQTLSPQQILVVKLLELPAVELEDRIHAELLENPALEEGKEENATDNEYSDTENAEDGMDSDANDYERTTVRKMNKRRIFHFPTPPLFMKS